MLDSPPLALVNNRTADLWDAMRIGALGFVTNPTDEAPPPDLPLLYSNFRI